MKKFQFFLICMIYSIAFLVVANDPWVTEYSKNDPDAGSLLLVGIMAGIFCSIWAAMTSKPLIRAILWVAIPLFFAIYGVGASMILVIMMVSMWRFIEGNPEIRGSIERFMATKD